MWESAPGINWRHDAQGNERPFSAYSYPVIHVSWNDARAYCAWLSKKTGDHYHLPSEAQWEYAARSRGKEVLYSWGNQENDGKSEGNLADETGKTQMKHLFIKEGYDDGYAYTSPVGSFPPNALGAYDMTGNVWEWCEDYYLADYPASPPKDYCCLEGKRYRVVRGGSWFDRLRYCRVTKRNSNYPELSAGHYGFRVAMTPR
jgi:formylglycine-generating enzyme required for sulfatase activity